MTAPKPNGPGRGRAKQDPNFKFRQEIQMWETAMIHGSFRLEWETHNKAVAISHKINMARAAMREFGGAGWIEWDNFTVKVRDNAVLIEPKKLHDLSGATDAQGNPINVVPLINIPLRERGFRRSDNAAFTEADLIRLRQQEQTVDPTKPLDLE